MVDKYRGALDCTGLENNLRIVNNLNNGPYCQLLVVVELHHNLFLPLAIVLLAGCSS